MSCISFLFSSWIIMYHYVGEGDAGGELEGVVAVGHAAG